MAYDLGIYGFTKCILYDNFTDLDMPYWENISKTIETQVEDRSFEYHRKALFDASGNSSVPLYEWGPKLDEGSYGRVYQATRRLYLRNNMGVYKIDKSYKEEIVIKESLLNLSPDEQALNNTPREEVVAAEIQVHIHEAATMALAYLVVKDTHMEYAVPKIYEVFLRSKFTKTPTIFDISSLCIAMEYIHRRTLMVYLSNNLRYNDKRHNDKIFLHFLKQLAELLQILQTRLRMNHRDIKINNILIRDPENPAPKLVLIDYGFACIAKGPRFPDTDASKIEAGSYFGSRYTCFKRGRDICQYIYSIHCVFPLETILSTELYKCVRKLMTVKYRFGTADLLLGVSTDGTPSLFQRGSVDFDEGIYLFLRRKEVDPYFCAPEIILKEIAEFEQKQPK